jgi:hypothetical protein
MDEKPAAPAAGLCFFNTASRPQPAAGLPMKKTVDLAIDDQ